MQKKIALINDVTGFGRCSIAVMAPIVSAMKIQAVTVPTAILSTHTQFPLYYFDDYTDKMSDYIDIYKKLKLEFDGIATGFLGSSKQVDIVIDFLDNFKEKASCILIDPVMGDYGQIYKTYTKELCDKMRDLVKYGDIVTPNLTELYALLGEKYNNEEVPEEVILEKCERLSKLGPKHVVVTGISIGTTKIANFIYSENGEHSTIVVDRIGEDRCGTGDVTAAVIAGMYMNGHSIYESVKKATEFVSHCIRYCEDNNVPKHYGLCFEMFMNELV